MYIVAVPNGFIPGVKAFYFPQPGGCTKEELPTELKTRAASIFREKFPSAHKLVGNPRELFSFEQYGCTDAAETIVNHYNSK